MNLVVDPFPPRLGGIGSIENGHFVVLVFEPSQHVLNSCFRGCSSGFLSFWVVDVEEFGIRVWVVIPSVFSYVENFCLDGGPLEVALDWGRLENIERDLLKDKTFAGYQTLPTSGQPDHDLVGK